MGVGNGGEGWSELCVELIRASSKASSAFRARFSQLTPIPSDIFSRFSAPPLPPPGISEPAPESTFLSHPYCSLSIRYRVSLSLGRIFFFFLIATRRPSVFASRYRRVSNFRIPVRLLFFSLFLSLPVSSGVLERTYFWRTCCQVNGSSTPARGEDGEAISAPGDSSQTAVGNGIE